MKTKDLIERWHPGWQPAVKQSLDQMKLYEGLIHSYNVEKVVSLLHRALAFQYFRPHFNSSSVFSLDITPHDLSRFPDVARKIDNIVTTCGWMVAIINVDVGRDKPLAYQSIDKLLATPNLRDVLMNAYGIQIIFEAKFGQELSEKEKVAITALYHVTLAANLKKIQAKGLIPKAGNKKAAHPDRIYMAVSLSDAQEFTDMIEGDEFDILKIDRSILDKIRVFRDPAFTDAVFTMENIPPNYIVEVIPVSVSR